MWKLVTLFALALFYVYPTVSDEGTNDFGSPASITKRINIKHVC